MQNQGRILAAIRSAKRLKQPYLAAKLHISQSQYSKIERGKKQLTIDQLITIASLLRITPTVLLECLMLGMTSPDAAVTHILRVINNESGSTLNDGEMRAANQTINEFIAANQFPLVRELIKIVRISGILEHPTPENISMPKDPDYPGAD